MAATEAQAYSACEKLTSGVRRSAWGSGVRAADAGAALGTRKTYVREWQHEHLRRNWESLCFRWGGLTEGMELSVAALLGQGDEFM